MRKILSLIRWLFIMIINLLGFLTAPIIFPLLYPFRNTMLRETKPFWYYFDDEDEFGFDLEWWMKGRKKGFWMAYLWGAIRNPAWNLQASLKPRGGTELVVSYKGLLLRDWRKLRETEMEVLKYVDAEGEYKDNKGEFLSEKYSIFGSMFLWFEKEGRLYWRYSIAKKIIGRLWIEFQIGITKKRYTFRLKLKRVKLWRKEIERIERNSTKRD